MREDRRVPWVETASPHFAARHELVDDDDVAGVLELLEGTRERLAGAFPAVPEEVEVVVHGSDAALAAVDAVPTEASAMALRCARGATGRAPIREGRRTVPLTPEGGRVFFFDPEVALATAARLAAAIRDARDLEHAHDILVGLGVPRTELAYERAAAAAG